MKLEAEDKPTTIGGHPRGLYYLAFTEMWERFSFYGMSALLTLFMVDQLLKPDHAGAVIGLAQLRHLFELAGPLSDKAFAQIVYGWYSGLVYFTPIVGGWIADRWLGKKRTVMLGALLMSAGHFAMTFDTSFVFALLLLILGSGCLKGNISAQVGTLYPQAAAALRDRGFAIFSTGINIGAASGPLVTGAVAAVYGWHAGFAVAAMLMLAALAVYLAGQPHLPETPPHARKARSEASLTAAERRRVIALMAAIALTIPAEITYPMVWSTGLLWVNEHVALGTPFGTVPASWFASVDSIGSIIAAPLLLALWARQARVGAEPNSLTKMAIGTALVGACALFFALGSYLAEGPRSVPVVWALAGFLGMGFGWMYYWPTTLALASRTAPAKVNAMMVGGAFVSPFIAHTLAGWISGLNYERMGPALFWTLDAGIGLAGAVVLFLVRKPLTAALRTESDPG